MPLIFVYHFSHLKFTDISFVSSSRKTAARMYGLYSFTLRPLWVSQSLFKVETSGAVGTKRLSLSGNQQVKALKIKAFKF